MGKILIALVVLLPLISIAHGALLDSFTCSAFHIACSSNTITNSTVPVATNSNNSTLLPPQNTTIATNALAGSLSLISSAQLSPGTEQYNYRIILPKRLLGNSSIFTFYLLGSYNNTLGFEYPAAVSCNITYQINCTAVFIVTVGSFDRLEIVRDGQWLYALKLPASIVTANLRAVTLVPQKTNENDRYILYGLGIISVVMIVGNVSYDQYRIRKNPNAYNEVNP